MRGFITSLFIFSCTLFSFGQNENNRWYFGGNAALNFNSGSPINISGSQLLTSEGCSSISDALGNLLFYTDGITVWNKLNIAMPNGFGLGGNPSTTQSAIIIPKPGSSTLYYIFTIGELGGAMTYTMVDMSLAGGNGDVVASSKNTALHPSVSEKQSAIRRCDGNIWVLSHEWGTNRFFADLITPTGISPSVMSSVGVVHIGGSQPFFNAVGQMKISQQGNRIAMAIRDIGSYSVYDFDINTGLVSNPLNFTGYFTAYGVEFSPDGTKLYGSQLSPGRVFQFNLMAGSTAAIAASATQVGSYFNLMCSIQLASNGKIYIAKSQSQTIGANSLDVINAPNNPSGTIGYVAGGTALTGGVSLLGLPNIMVISLSASNINVAGPTTICLGQSTTLSASGGTSYSWSGGASSTSNSITVSPTTNTTYYVTGTTACGTDTDTINVTVQTVLDITVTGNTTICPGQSTTLTASGASSYSWTGGAVATGNSITVSPSVTTVYYANGNSPCGTDTDTITVFVSATSTAAFSFSTQECSDKTIFSNTSTAGTSFLWDFGDGSTSATANPEHLYTQSGNYSVTLTVNPGTSCSSSVSLPVVISFIGASGIIIPNIFTPNNDGVNDEFKIIGLNSCSEYELIIYNRWGQKVFETTNASSVFWNGKNGNKNEIIEGVYFYILNTTNNSNKKDSITGYVTLVN
jgi:gliding motility-associated-like protein